MAPRPRRRAPRVAFPSVLHQPFLTLVLALAILGGPRPALATGDVTGQWSPNADSSRGQPGRYAIHLVLLRGDAQPYHSRILWWSGDRFGSFSGSEWGWRPASPGCDAFPDTSSLSAIYVPPSGINEFCAGHVPINGRLFVAGGTDSLTGAYGENRARVLRDTSGIASRSWYDPGTMAQWRWYPSETVLGGADGRILVTAGQSAPHHRYFGGRRNGSIPTGGVQDSLYRFFPVAGGRWDRSVIPLTDPAYGRPTWRERHTAAQMEIYSNINGHVIFGGRDSLGLPLNDLWVLERQPNITGNDYLYQWKKRVLSDAPSARSDHSAIVSTGAPFDSVSMFVYGGRDQSGSAVPGRVYRYWGFGGGKWSNFLPGGSTTPPARFGHTAIYDNNSTNGNRMIVFGGIGADGQTPTDLTVWDLRFTSSDFSSGTWYAATQVVADTAGSDRRPAPRYGHTLAWDPNPHHNSRADKNGHVGFLFGGQLGGTAYSDTLWRLWLFDDGTVGWEPKLFGGPRPGARARHAMVLDPNQGLAPFGVRPARLFLCGGDSAAVAADDSVYVVDPWAAAPRWEKWAGRGVALAGESVTLDRQVTDARTPQVFNPGASSAGQWQSPLASSTLLQHTYPPTFVISGGTLTGHRVLSIAQDDSSYWLDVAASGAGNPWTRQANLGFAPESGVLYRPNRILMAGGTQKTGSSTVVGTTKTLDAGNLGNTWQVSGSMVPRTFTNLVLLPNGQVLAVGGMSSANVGDTSPALAVRRPQIWDPGTGAWTDTTVLASQPTMRNYHSTAVLLPDGRVLSGGGEFQSEKFLFNLFCPPYLFKSGTDLLAARPSLSSAPGAMSWGSLGTYTLCPADTTGIRGVCLIRPGATTHGFDQNERYVPLAFTVATNPSRLLVTGPADGAAAPPGDYLLFVTGSADRSDIPSIARWVRVGGATAFDSCDATAPATVSNLSATACPGTTDNEWRLTWTAPADDGSLTASGRVMSYDIRQYSGPINDGNWDSALPIAAPSPGPPGSTDEVVVTVTGRTYVRLKARDDRNNWTGLSNQVTLLAVDCSGGGMFAGGGGGGDGFALATGPGAASLQPSAASAPAPAENSVLNGVPAGASGEDTYRLGDLNVAADGACAVRVREAPDHAAALDAAELLVIDHAAGVSAYSANGTILLGKPQGASHVASLEGSDLTSKLTGGGGCTLGPGDTLVVELGPGGGASPLLLAASGPGPVEVGIPDGQGGWQPATPCYPRAAPDELTLPAPGSDRVRLSCASSASLTFVGHLAVSAVASAAQRVSLVSAHDARLGEAAGAVASRDSVSLTLLGPDTLTLRYVLPPQPQDATRDYLLRLSATPLDPGTLAPATLRQHEELPSRFALRQNEPNPFSAATVIRFDLPVGAPVRLELFDAQGRRLTTLANRYFPPGYHAVAWARAAGGGSVEPGVYFCRIEAGPFRERRKMVLLPRK